MSTIPPYRSRPSVMTRPSTMPRPSIAREDQNKRSACDRCRRQKLRCERRHSATTKNACNRCLKSRSKCETSPSLPMGRPRIKARSTSPPATRALRGDTPLTDSHSNLVADSRIRAKAASISYSVSPSPAVYLEPLEIPATSYSEPQFQVFETQADALFDFSLPEKDASCTIFDSFQDFNYLGQLGVMSTLPKQPEPALSSISEHSPEMQTLKVEPVATDYGLLWPNCSQQSLAAPASMIPTQYTPTLEPVTSVATLLDNSNDFIRISENALSWTPSHSPLPSRHPSIDLASAYGTEMSALGMHPANAIPQLNMQTGLSPVFSQGSYESIDSRLSPSPLSSLAPSLAASAVSLVSERSESSPNMAAIIRRYASLLRTYRSILTRLHITVLSQPLTGAALERVLPGICPADFEIDPQTQARIFVQVCRDTLQRMEKNAMMIALAYKGGVYGQQRQDMVAWAVLDSVVREQTGEGVDGPCGNSSWRLVINDITSILDGYLGL